MQLCQRWSGTYGGRGRLLNRDLLPCLQQRPQQARSLFEPLVRLLTVPENNLLGNVVVEVSEISAELPSRRSVQAKRKLRYGIVGTVDGPDAPGDIPGCKAPAGLADAVDRTPVKKGYEFQRRGACRRILHVLLVRVCHSLSAFFIDRNLAVFGKFPLVCALLLASLVNAASPDDAQRNAADRQTQASRRQAKPVPGQTFFTTEWLSGREWFDERRTAPPDAAISASCEPVSEEQLQALVAAAAREHGVDPALVRAVIRRESASVPCAVSPKGAQGLMQLMPSVQSRFGVTQPFDPAANIGAGTRYLKELITRYKGNLSLVLAAYNAGPQRVDDAGGKVPDISETKSYVAAILADLERAQDPSRI